MKMTKTLKRVLLSVCSAVFCLMMGVVAILGASVSAKAEVVTTTVMYCDGASIRLAEDGLNGIRFHVRVTSNADKTVTLDGVTYSESDFKKLTTGILVIPSDKLANAEELTIEGATTAYKSGAKAANVTGDECVWNFKSDENGNYFYEATAYVYNIPETSYDRDFTFRGYYIADGKYVYTENVNERSVSYVAMAAKKDGYDGEYKAQLNSFLPQRVSVSKNLTNVDKFLYRVGNQNTVALSSLFDLDNDVAVNDLTVDFDSNNVTGSLNGTNIQFNNTGAVTVSIIDQYSRNAVKLNLEVIDAKNITKAESATANDVVLLNDISGTFVVSNGHTFYGNGFTVTLPTTSVQNVGNGFTGYISVGATQDDGIANGGNLDNVRIEGPVYPEMYIYRDQAKITDSKDADYGDGYNMRYFRNSVIIYGGNCTISNSYISGSRTALCLRGGNNVVIENTTLAGGAYANMQICAGSNITLRNVTTVQVDVNDSYGKGKVAHGLGIAVDSDVVDLYIEGELNQYNWLNQTQWNSIVPSNYQASFPKFFTDNSFSKNWHYLNGETAPYVNMAFIFACNWDTSKIHDNRSTVDYGTTSATIATVSGGVYTNINTVGGNAITNADLVAPEYVPIGFNPVAPTLNFDNSPNADEDDANDANDTYCVYNESTGTLKIGITGESKTLDLSKVAVMKNGTALAHTSYLNGTKISGNSITINAVDGATQTLMFKATSNDMGYDKEGKPIDGSIEYTWTITVEVATLSYPAPEWNMGGNYQFAATSNGIYAYYGTSNGYGEAVQIYEGIKINYYDKNGKLVNLDLSGTTAHPTGSNNSNSNAFTYTLSDGSTLTMKYSSGWKSGATTHQFTTYQNKVYIYPQSLDNDNYIRAKVANQDFDVKISYTFTDPNGQSITQTMRWYNEKSTNSKVSTVQWKTFDTVNGKKAQVCVTPDTLVTLADGTQKAVEDLQVGDMLLVFNHYTGKYDVRPLAINAHADEDAQWYDVLNVQFSNGTLWRIAGTHGIYDCTLNEYVMISAENIDEFVGHQFYYTDGQNGQYVTLTGYYCTEEFIKIYSPATFELVNYFANGLLNAPPFPDSYTSGQVNYFDFDENMQYNEAQVQADIEKYGLYTYEDLADYISEDVFNAFPFKYFKISVGKGLMTWEDIMAVIEMLFAE